MKLVKIYGMSTCPDCAYLYDQIEGQEQFEMIDIGTHVKLLKEFLAIRDNHPVFDEIKKDGKAGIPCFVLEDGSVTLNPEDVGLRSRSEDGDSVCCGIDGC